MQSFKIIKPIHILTPYVRYYWILEDGADVSVSERTLPCLLYTSDAADE